VTHSTFYACARMMQLRMPPAANAGARRSVGAGACV
jgi:hypothetical protein